VSVPHLQARRCCANSPSQAGKIISVWGFERSFTDPEKSAQDTDLVS